MATGGEDSEVFLLLQEYCSRRSQQRSRQRSGGHGSWRKVVLEQQAVYAQGPGDHTPPAPSFSTVVDIQIQKHHITHQGGRSDGTEVKHDITYQGWGSDSTEVKHESPATSAAVERLVQITDSAPLPAAGNQDEIIQKLVDLMLTFGDDMNQKIKQNPLLRQQLCNLNYDLFEKLTSSVQNLLDPAGRAAASEERVQQQKIAWAFEVTSRLSAVGVVQQRRVLSFGHRYIRQHHSAWVQQHGGWEEVFAVD